MKTTEKQTHYDYWSNGKNAVRIRLEVGKDGVTQDWIDILIEMDEKEKSKQEKFERNEWNFDEDMLSFKKLREDRQELPRTITGRPIYDLFHEEEDEPDPREELVHEYLDTLKADRQECAYRHYGMWQSFEEVGQAMGKKKQSAHEQVQRLKKNVKEYVEANHLKNPDEISKDIEG